MNLQLIVGLTLVGAGLPMCFRAFRSRARRLALLRNCVRVEGKVVRFEDMPESESTISESISPSVSAAVVEYRDQKRRRHELTLPEQSYHHFHRVGSKVVVYFERDKPENATSVNGIWDVNVICGLCLTVLLIGVGALYTAYQDSTDGSSEAAANAVGD